MKKNMTREDAARIQSAACKANNGVTPKKSFAARAMRAAYKNEPLTSESKNRNTSENENNIGLFAVVAGMTAAGYYLYQSLKPTEERKEQMQPANFRTNTSSTISGRTACKIGFFAIVSAGVAISTYYAYQSLNLSK